jgi:transposase
MKLQNLEKKRHFVSDKFIVGIDPAKQKHQAMVLDPKGIPVGNSFPFTNSYNGFHFKLWQKLKALPYEITPENTAFAVEISINYWQKICHYLSEKGYTVLMVRPITTKHERPRLNNFSRTDPKDALCIASSARQGYFNFYQKYDDDILGIHRLGITYDKLKKQIVIAKQRLRSEVEMLFPEFPGILKIDTDTARYLLSKYLSAKDFSEINVFYEAIELVAISRNHHGAATLKALKEAATKSIGLPLDKVGYMAHRMTVNMWIEQIKMLKIQQYNILREMSALAQKTPFFKLLNSIKGISEITAARFIAEIPQLGNDLHFKQVEAFAGLNLRLSESGQITGYRRISHWGNNRLRAVLYKMTEETKNHIPEIRIRFLKRQMKNPTYTKNITACTSNLLKIIIALIRDNRCYEFDPEKVKEMEALDNQYQEQKEKRQSKAFKKAV